MENIFFENIKDERLHNSIHMFKKNFFEIDHTERTKKHVSDPNEGLSIKKDKYVLEMDDKKR